jgi:hypothetical protein
MRNSCIALVAVVALVGCSSRPREFTPTLAAPAADQAAYLATYESCRIAAASGKRSIGTSANAGATATMATAAAGTAAATTAGGYAGLAVLGATVVALPVVGVLGAWGMAKKKKLKKEGKVKDNTAACLGENGYQVAGWQQASGDVTEQRRDARKAKK